VTDIYAYTRVSGSETMNLR